MARITVEDCLEQLPNRFSLVLISAERAKQLLRGSQPLIDNVEGNKEVVVSLREIAAGHFDIDEADVTAHHDWLPVGHKEAEAQIAAASVDVDDELPPEF